MKYADVVTVDLIRVGLKSTHRDEALRSLVDVLVETGRLTDSDEALRRLLAREMLGSTGVERQCACPHFRCSELVRSAMVVGISSEPIDWETLDNNGVKIIFLIATPPDRPGDHLRLLELVMRSANQDDFLNFLRQCRTPAEVYELMMEMDEMRRD